MELESQLDEAIDAMTVWILRQLEVQVNDCLSPLLLTSGGIAIWLLKREGGIQMPLIE